MDELKVGAGSDILIGAPANPLHPDAVQAITTAVNALSGVQEAHLPQCFIPGVSQAPAQVLVLVLRTGGSPDAVMAAVGPQLQNIVPRGIHLDVWPLPVDHELLPAIRSAGCQITGGAPAASPPRRWWQFWR